eukprot:1372357-Amphidinium_carterae.1
MAYVFPPPFGVEPFFTAVLWCFARLGRHFGETLRKVGKSTFFQTRKVRSMSRLRSIYNSVQERVIWAAVL